MDVSKRSYLVGSTVKNQPSELDISATNQTLQEHELILVGNSVAQVPKKQSKMEAITMNNTPLLTGREVECLQWIAFGKTSGVIAILLNISESTVNFHLKNVLQKLNADNRAHAVAKALSQSLINPL